MRDAEFHDVEVDRKNEHGLLHIEENFEHFHELDSSGRLESVEVIDEEDNLFNTLQIAVRVHHLGELETEVEDAIGRGELYRLSITAPFFGAAESSIIGGT